MLLCYVISGDAVNNRRISSSCTPPLWLSLSCLDLSFVWNYPNTRIRLVLVISVSSRQFNDGLTPYQRDFLIVRWPMAHIGTRKHIHAIELWSTRLEWPPVSLDQPLLSKCAAVLAHVLHVSIYQSWSF
jgi:hypothetical protein